MNILAQTVAQTASALDAHPLLLAYGPMGLMLAWFMWLSNYMAKQVMSMIHEHGLKMGAIIHQIAGLRMAILLSTISDEKTSDFVRKQCEDELAKANASQSKEK